MAVYVVTGKLGAGKTLIAVGKIQDKIVSGCKVATNLDLRLHKYPQVGINAKSPRVMRIPDKPTLDDLMVIGKGNASYDESKNGLLVLDECGTWFNSRSWADKSRQDVINWFLHARKLGWDIIFLIQDLSIMDKQARVALAEHVVYCRRLDRVTLPFIGSVYSLFTGNKLPLPKIHLGIVKYGDSANSMTVERWTYTGRNLYNAYDTKQSFSDGYKDSVFSYLPPYLSHGRYSSPKSGMFYMKITKIYFKKLSRIICFLLGVFLSFVFLSIGHSDRKEHFQPISKVTTSKSDLNVDDLTIRSVSRYGNNINIVFNDSKGKYYTDKDLSSHGYLMTFIDACTILISKGEKDAKAHC